MGNCFSQKGEDNNNPPDLTIEDAGEQANSSILLTLSENPQRSRILGAKLLLKLSTSNRKLSNLSTTSKSPASPLSSSPLVKNMFNTSSSGQLTASVDDASSRTRSVSSATATSTSSAGSMAMRNKYHLVDVLFDMVGFECLYRFSKKEFSFENIDLFKVLITISPGDMIGRITPELVNLFSMAVSNKIVENTPGLDESGCFIEKMKRVEDEYLSPGSDFEMNIGFCTFALLSKKRKGEFDTVSSPFVTASVPKPASNLLVTTSSPVLEFDQTGQDIELETTNNLTQLAPETNETTTIAETKISADYPVVDKQQQPEIESPQITDPNLLYYKLLHKAMLDDCMSNLHDVFVRFMDSKEFEKFLESRNGQ